MTGPGRPRGLPPGRPLWTAADLLEATGGRFGAPFDASGVSIDTRTIQPGDLFVALIGEAGDGHDHAARAIEAGAAGVMLHRDIPGIENRLVVDDTLAGLTRLGAFARARFSGRVVAVTGSVGKTTTKEMLRVALSAFGPVHAAVASYNNHWGVPLTLARTPLAASTCSVRLPSSRFQGDAPVRAPNGTSRPSPDGAPAGAQGAIAFCVVEIGMNHAGEIAPLARLAQPHVAVITTIEAAHIGHLGGMAEIAEEKAAILSGLDIGGVAVLPADSPWFRLLRERAGTHRIISFGSAPDAGARLLEVQPEANHSTVRVDIAGHEMRLRLNAPGRHMAMNAVAALAAVAALGLDTAEAAHALEAFAPLPGRGAHRRLLLPASGSLASGSLASGNLASGNLASGNLASGNLASGNLGDGKAAGGKAAGAALLLDESYNANGASMRAALDVLRLQPAVRRVAILGDMLELGEAGPAEHAALAEDVARSADLVFTCGPLMRHLFDALPAAIRGQHAGSAAALAPIAAARIAAGDAILVKGSLGSRMKTIVAALDALTLIGEEHVG